MIEVFNSVDYKGISQPSFEFRDDCLYICSTTKSEAKKVRYTDLDKIYFNLLFASNDIGCVIYRKKNREFGYLYFDLNDKQRMIDSLAKVHPLIVKDANYEEGKTDDNNKSYQKSQVNVSKVETSDNSKSTKKEKTKKSKEDTFADFVDRHANIIAVIILILVAIVVIKGCIWFFSDDGSGEEYTTYWYDEDGDGKRDAGEYSWTEDEDGNITNVG